MKKISAILFLLVISAVTLSAQVRLDQSTDMRDSTGKRVAYANWQKMMMSGDYTIKPTPGKEGSFTLIKRTEEEKRRLYEAMKGRVTPGPPSPFFTTGDKLSSFSVRDINSGEVFKSKALLGKVVVLNFWFVDCPPCRAEIPHLNELVKSYEGNPDVVFIAIALDEAGTLRRFLRETPFSYHVASDKYTAAELYKIKGYPTNVVVGKDGTIALHTTGGLPIPGVNWLKKNIDEALAKTAP